MSGPEFNPADDEPIDRKEWEKWEKWEREKFATSDPTEKRLEEIEQTIKTCGMTGGSQAEFLISTVRAQARELAALREPMPCGHPKICCHSVGELTAINGSQEASDYICDWCESEKALRGPRKNAEFWKGRYMLLEKTYAEDIRRLVSERDRLAQENGKMREAAKRVCDDPRSTRFIEELEKALSAHPASR